MAGFNPQAGGQVGFPGLWWSQKNNVAPLMQIRAAGQVGNDVAGCCGLEIVIEFF